MTVPWHPGLPRALPRRRYERLQKIMILSVIKRTPARVKFWFIKNYMSPQVS